MDPTFKSGCNYSLCSRQDCCKCWQFLLCNLQTCQKGEKDRAKGTRTGRSSTLKYARTYQFIAMLMSNNTFSRRRFFFTRRLSSIPRADSGRKYCRNGRHWVAWPVHVKAWNLTSYRDRNIKTDFDYFLPPRAFVKHHLSRLEVNFVVILVVVENVQRPGFVDLLGNVDYGTDDVGL